MSYVARELSQRNKLLFGLGSFLIPILIWCAVSYLPFIWHPQVQITDSGSVAYLQVDSRIDKDESFFCCAICSRSRSGSAAGYSGQPDLSACTA